MVADILIPLLGAIYFRLFIISCDYNIIASLVFWKNKIEESNIYT